MNALIKSLFFSLLFITSYSSASTDGKVDFSKFDHKETLEIAPERWLDVYYDRENQGFVFEWNGKIVRKKIAIKYNDADEMLLSLREKEGLLYMIFLNRIDIHKVTYDFYKMNEDGTGFVNIAPKDYPRDIATQNRLMSYFGSARDRDGNPIDDMKLLRNLDVEDGHFVFQCTAQIWICLEKKIQQHNVNSIGMEEQQKIAREYKRKYKPIVLRNLVREKLK